MGSERVVDTCCVAVLLTSQYIWQWKWLNFTDIHNHWQAAPFRILQQHPLIRRYRSDADAFASSPEYPCIRYNTTPLLPLQSAMSSILSNHSAATFKVIKSNTETVFFAHYSFPPPLLTFNQLPINSDPPTARDDTSRTSTYARIIIRLWQWYTYTVCYLIKRYAVLLGITAAFAGEAKERDRRGAIQIQCPTISPLLKDEHRLGFMWV